MNYGTEDNRKVKGILFPMEEQGLEKIPKGTSCNKGGGGEREREREKVRGAGGGGRGEGRADERVLRAVESL